MQGADFIFFLQDKQNRFWGLNSSGNVVLNANPYPLVFSPDGWEEIGIKNVRNKKYWAIDRSVSLAFKYVEDAAKILKYIFYVKGVEESVYLTICEQRLKYEENVSYGYWYKQVFKSEIDLSTYQHNGADVTCNTLEDGLAKHLKANENTVYELDLDTVVKLDGIVLKSSINFLSISEFHSALVSDYNLLWLPVAYVGTDGTTPNTAGLSATHEEWNGTSSHDDNRYLDNFFLTATDTVTVNIKATITATLRSGISLELYIKNSNGTRTQLFILNSDNPATTSPFVKEQTYDIDVNVNMVADEKLYLISEVVESPLIPGVGSGEYQEFSFSIKSEERFRTTYIYAKRPQDVFAELISKISEGEYTADECPYFGELQNWNKVFTSGDAIRGIEGAKLKISLSLFFEFWDTYDAVGFREFDKKVLFDRKAALTNNTDLINLGEASKLVLRFDNSFSYNELAVGYPDVKNESGMLNGKNEVNTTFNFTLGTTKTPRKDEKVSKIKVSCYDIENIRIEGAGKDTTDRKSDNDVYALHISNTLIEASGDTPAHYELNREYNTYVSGVDQISSVFNLIFSPKNCIIRSGDFIHSSFHKCDNKKFKFVSADRNDAMEYINGSTVIIEKADVLIGGLADPFFTPVSLEIEIDAPEDLLDLLDADPTKGFEFTFEGDTYKGISVENSINPKTNKKQTYKLLNHPDNNLSKLINYYG